ncbi:hypothetical protein COOONC_01079 [Cooperia oncophora]
MIADDVHVHEKDLKGIKGYQDGLVQKRESKVNSEALHRDRPRRPLLEGVVSEDPRSEVSLLGQVFATIQKEYNLDERIWLMISVSECCAKKREVQGRDKKRESPEHNPRNIVRLCRRECTTHNWKRLVRNWLYGRLCATLNCLVCPAGEEGGCTIPGRST